MSKGKAWGNFIENDIATLPDSSGYCYFNAGYDAAMVEADRLKFELAGITDRLRIKEEENARLREALELIRDICGFDACDIAHKALERGE